MTQKVIYLHVGHNKTGSSFLQQVFLRNRDHLLERHGIHYPALPFMLQGEDAYRVTSGNGFMVYEDPAQWQDATGKATSYLFSREQFFMDFLEDKNRAVLGELRQELGAERIEMLLFVRDPIRYAMSAYQQTVKTGGTQDIDAFLGQFSVQPLYDFIRLMQQEDAVRLTLRNYERVKGDMVAETAAWLGLTAQDIHHWDIPAGLVNRSLTLGEYHIQQAINRHLPRPVSNAFYRSLVQHYPQAKAAEFIPSAKAQAEYLHRDRACLEAINGWLPEGQAYDLAPLAYAPPAQEGLTLTPEHFTVLGEAICQLYEKASSQGFKGDAARFSGVRRQLAWRQRAGQWLRQLLAPCDKKKG